MEARVRTGSFLSLLAWVAFSASTAFASPAVQQGEEIIVRSRTAAMHATTLNSGSLSTVREFGRMATMHIEETRSDAADRFAAATAACSALIAQRPELECEPNVIFHATTEPNDGYWNYNWNLKRIGMPAAWDVTTGSKKVIVAVVDTGIDYTHPDLEPAIAVNSGEIPGNGFDDDGDGYVDDYLGYDFAGKSSDPFDMNGHGTHVAGVIGAQLNDSYGVPGIAPATALLPVRVLDENGEGTLANVIAGINYAVSRHASIINLSLGAPYGSKMFLAALQHAQEAGVLIVVAAGNERTDNDVTPSYPANYSLSGLVSVAATTEDDRLADFSNYGATTVHLAAPGDSVLSTYPGMQYAFMSGTSMASPHVAGVAALVRALRPELTPAQVRSLLLASVDVSPELNGKVLSGGRLNAAAAVTAAVTGVTPDAGDSDATQIAIDLRSHATRKAGQIVFIAQVYEVSTRAGISQKRVALQCGPAVVAHAITNSSGVATFKKIMKPRKATRCVAIVEGNAATESNTVRLKPGSREARH